MAKPGAKQSTSKKTQIKQQQSVESSTDDSSVQSSRLNAPVTSDGRFSKLFNNPRFERIAQNKRKVSVDQRFSRMFSGEEFTTESELYVLVHFTYSHFFQLQSINMVDPYHIQQKKTSRNIISLKDNPNNRPSHLCPLLPHLTLNKTNLLNHLTPLKILLILLHKWNFKRRQVTMKTTN